MNAPEVSLSNQWPLTLLRLRTRVIFPRRRFSARGPFRTRIFKSKLQAEVEGINTNYIRPSVCYS